MNFHFTGKDQARAEVAAWFELLEKSFNTVDDGSGMDRFKVKILPKDDSGNHPFAINYKDDSGGMTPKLTGTVSFDDNGDATYTPVLTFDEHSLRLPLTDNTHDKAYHVVGCMMAAALKQEEAFTGTTLTTTYREALEQPSPAAAADAQENSWARDAMDTARNWVRGAFRPRAHA